MMKRFSQFIHTLKCFVNINHVPLDEWHLIMNKGDQNKQHQQSTHTPR